MTETHSIVDRVIVARLVARLAPYVKDGHVLHSRLERVIQSVAGDELIRVALQAEVVEKLTAAGLVIERDTTPLRTPAALTILPTSTATIGMEEHGSVGESDDAPGIDLGDEERVDVDFDEAVAHARTFLDLSARLRRPERRLLTAELEVGLALLMRSDGRPVSQDLPDDFRRRQPDDSEAARAFDALVVHNRRLVWSIALRYAGQTERLEMEDVAAYGHVGLIRAVQKFDAGMGNKFSTYATWWIRQAITRALLDHGRLIRIPVHLGEKITRTRAAYTRLTAVNIKPTLRRLAAETGFTEKDISLHFELMQGIHSLEAPMGDGDATLQDYLMSRTTDNDALDGLDRRILRSEIEKSLGGLTEREADVIRLRFGFVDEEKWTLDEIGKLFDLTRERIRQIESKAMTKLQSPSNNGRLLHWMNTVDE